MPEPCKEAKALASDLILTFSHTRWSNDELELVINALAQKIQAVIDKAKEQ